MHELVYIHVKSFRQCWHQKLEWRKMWSLCLRLWLWPGLSISEILNDLGELMSWDFLRHTPVSNVSWCIEKKIPVSNTSAGSNALFLRGIMGEWPRYSLLLQNSHQYGKTYEHGNFQPGSFWVGHLFLSRVEPVVLASVPDYKCLWCCWNSNPNSKLKGTKTDVSSLGHFTLKAGWSQ